MNGGWWRMLGWALSLSLCVQAQADDGRGGRGGTGGERGVAHGQPGPGRGEAYGGSWDRIPTGVRAGWWRPCRAGTCGCPIAAASISSTTATGTDPTARAMCWSLPPRSARPQPAALCGAGLAGQRAVLPAAGTYYPWHADTREYEVVSRRRGQRTRLSGQRAGRQLRRGGLPRARPGPPTSEGRDRCECHTLGGGRERLRPGGATYAPAAEVANGYRRATGRLPERARLQRQLTVSLPTTSCGSAWISTSAFGYSRLIASTARSVRRVGHRQAQLAGQFEVQLDEPVVAGNPRAHVVRAEHSRHAAGEFRACAR